MFDLGEFFFKHFEKMLMVLFGTVLAFSIVLYGPWTYSTKFDGSLDEIVRSFDDRPTINVEDIPEVPDYLDTLEKAGVAAEQPPFDRPYFWKVLEREEGTVMVLPPSSVLAVGMRGYVRVRWEHNTNQPKAEGMFDFTGVEIQRATVIDDVTGAFEVLTRVGAVDYFTPRLLYDNNAKNAPIVQRQEKQEKRGRGSISGLTTRDLFNAVYDGRLKISDITKIIRQGVQKGYFGARDAYNANNMLLEIYMEVRETRREMRLDGVGKTVSKQELIKEVLASRGYRGGGKWGKAPVISKATDEEAKKSAKEFVVRWAEIVNFYDSSVSPDRKYIYRTRFWGKEKNDAGILQRQSDWTFSGDAIASKSDTEFFLDGGMLEIGKPWIRVSKWIPERDSWVTRAYQVAVGEEIGRKEMVERLDRIGRPIRDASGKVAREEVDFSTKCVLLAFRQRPWVVVTASSAVASFDVDKPKSAQYPMLSGLQIVYSNRRGELRTKWETGSRSR